MPINRPDVYNVVGDAVVLGGGGGGATTFLALTDTPTSYVDQSGKVPVVGVNSLQFNYLPGTRVGGVVYDPITEQNTTLTANVWTAIPNMTMTWTASAETQIVCLHTSFAALSSVTGIEVGLSTDPGSFLDFGRTARYLGLMANAELKNLMFMWQLTSLSEGISYSVTPFLRPTKNAISHVGGVYQGAFLYAMHP